MKNLNKVLLNYLRNFGSKIIFTDHQRSYTGKEFLKKVLSYKSQICYGKPRIQRFSYHFRSGY